MFDSMWHLFNILNGYAKIFECRIDTNNLFQIYGKIHFLKISLHCSERPAISGHSQTPTPNFNH